MVRRGRLIVFEGGEASGKSTQAARLAAETRALLTREPGGTPLGEALRPFVLEASAGSLDDRTELLLMVASRAEHVASVLRPALDSGRDVVCDRFSGSTIAYQGYGRGLPLEDVLIACELATNGLAPDLNVLLDLGEEQSRARRARRQPDDRIEAAGGGFHARVRAGFLALAAADGDRWAVIDGSESEEAVARRIADVLVQRFGDDWAEGSR